MDGETEGEECMRVKMHKEGRKESYAWMEGEKRSIDGRKGSEKGRRRMDRREGAWMKR